MKQSSTAQNRGSSRSCAPLWRPPLCLAHDPEKAACCVEPPAQGQDGAPGRCALCGHGWPILEAILEAVFEQRDEGWNCTASSISEAIDVAREDRDKAIAELIDRDLVDRDGRRRLTLTDTGFAVVRRLRDGRLPRPEGAPSCPFKAGVAGA